LDGTKETYDEKYKGYEEKIKPVLMKLYQGMKSDEPLNSSGSSGPSVDEVD
jgi:hypothetical protein